MLTGEGQLGVGCYLVVVWNTNVHERLLAPWPLREALVGVTIGRNLPHVSKWILSQVYRKQFGE